MKLKIFHGVKADKLEAQLFKHLGKFNVDYAAAVDVSLFKRNSEAMKIWNTNYIWSPLMQLIEGNPNELNHYKGISSPFAYFDKAGTLFALHVEDLGLFSVNYNKGPGDKLWYVVEPKFYDDVKRIVEAELGKTDCSDQIQHKETFVRPELFDQNGIRYRRVIIIIDQFTQCAMKYSCNAHLYR